MSQSKIYIFSDLHFSREYKYKSDEFGVSVRTWSTVTLFESICEEIIKNNDCKLLIIAGDVFHTYQNNNPTLLQYLHKHTFPMLKKAKIGVLIIGGNHDQLSEYEPRMRS